MTKTVRVILCFVIISLPFFAVKVSHAEYLLQPIPNNYQSSYVPSQQLNNLTIEQSYTPPPSITFGDLLSSSNQPFDFAQGKQSTINNQQLTIPDKSATIRDLLSQLETSTQDSRNELLEFNNRSTHNTSTLQSSNPQPITHNQQPTPYIPVPTLIAGVSEIVSNQQQVLGVQQSNNETMKQWDNQSPSPNSPLITHNSKLITSYGNLSDNPIKTTYTVAVLGDSMVDTLGRELYHLKTLLAGVYPAYTFALLNYGQGATDLESGLYRLTNTTTYLGETFAPLLSFRPDILVVESFAYNHWSGQFYDLNRQWLTIAKIIDTVRENSPDTKIILAATIAPNSDIFGDGSLNWPENLKWESSQIIKAYLQNLVNFATSQNYPLADAYHPSLGSDGKGIRKYINGGDNLHPSGDGGWLFAQKIVEAIKENNLIK